MQLSIGNLSGVMAPFVRQSFLPMLPHVVFSVLTFFFPQLYETREGPRYTKGHAVTLGMVALASIVFASMSVYFMGRNSRRRAGLENKKIEGKTESEIAEMGDESPMYNFII